MMTNSPEPTLTLPASSSASSRSLNPRLSPKRRPNPDKRAGVHQPAGALEPVDEPRPQARRFPPSGELSVLVDAGGEVEQEQVLERDDLALHSGDLGDVREPACAVLQTLLMHDQLNRRSDLI